MDRVAPAWLGRRSAATQDRLLADRGPAGGPRRGDLGLLDAGEQVPAAFDLGKSLSSSPAIARKSKSAWHTCQVKTAPRLWWAICGGVSSQAPRAPTTTSSTKAPERALTPAQRLALTARGPRTDTAIQRANALSADRPVVEAVRNLFGLRRDMTLSELAGWLAELIPRVGSQEDYNALLDFINLSLHRREGNEPELEELWVPLLRLRSAFPALGSQTWAWGQLGIRAARTRPVEVTAVVLELVDQDALRLYTTDEGAVLKVAVQSGGAEAWALVMNAVQAGNWKLKLGVDGWFGGLAGLDDIRAWVGDDLHRARAVASVSTAGEASEMHEVAFYLLSDFPEDRRIESSLYSEFVSGLWTGNESARIKRQIALLEGWNRAHVGVAGVTHWCNGVLDSLRTRLATVLQEEAEEDWH